MAGLPALRAQIARKTLALYGRAVDPDTDVTVTSGAKQYVALHVYFVQVGVLLGA